MPISEAYNCDCMDYLRTVSDKFFDLAVVDPPYGLNSTSYAGAGKLKNRVMNQSSDKFREWDVPPGKEYFEELFRVSKNQIIWGGNYFDLPPTRCVICWDKVQPWENFSQIELAWTSFDMPAKLFRFDNRTGEKIHPSQKPIELYQWMLKTFIPQNGGGRILDTHMGSQSSRIAAYFAGLDFYGCEIDKEYFDLGCNRFDHKCKGILRLNGATMTEFTLF